MSIGSAGPRTAYEQPNDLYRVQQTALMRNKADLSRQKQELPGLFDTWGEVGVETRATESA